MTKINEKDKHVMYILAKDGESKTSIAKRLGISEGTVRYHLRGRDGRDEQAGDGRQKPTAIEAAGLATAVHDRWEKQKADLPVGRSPNATLLHEWLRAEHGFTGSVQSVRKHVRTRLDRPPLRCFRRVETPPGVQAQVDWSEYRDVSIPSIGLIGTLYIFHMILSHSRYRVDIACLGCDQLWWHYAHIEAFRRLGGVPAVARIDNCKTGVVVGSGAWGQLNKRYQSFSDYLRFHIDPCEAYHPEHKGKVERGVRTFRETESEFRQVALDGLDGLQTWLDAQAGMQAHRRLCPVTGTTVHDAWLAERDLLQPLPDPIPEPFDLRVSRPVHRDATVHFENHKYMVPFSYVGQQVEVRGCAKEVVIVDPATGAIIRRQPRHTKETLVYDPTCYEGESTATVLAPTPLGKMAQRIAELDADTVTRRSIDWYADLTEVAR